MSKNQDLGELINGIKSLGTNQLNAPAYTSATAFTGTIAGYLGFDSSGNILTTGASSQWITSGSNIYYNAGRVGIGTASPSQLFEVNNVTGAIIKNASGTRSIQLESYSADWNYITSAGQNLAIKADGAFPLVLFTNGVERMRILSNGNVGVGIDNPTEKFYVYANSPVRATVECVNGFYAISRYKNPYYTADIGIDDAGIYMDGGNSTFRIYNGANIRFQILTNGNVGIGVSPSYKLDVAGDVNITGSFRVNGTPIGTGGGGVSGSGSTNYLAKWSAGTALTNSQIFDNGSSIGLRTASPFYVIDYQLTGSLRLGYFIGSIDGTDNASGIVAHNGNGITQTVPFGFSGSKFAWYIGTNEAMRIDTNRNLLINTTGGVTGGGALQVNGDVNVTGTFRVNGVQYSTGGGGGGITGGGTADYIPKFTGSTSIGNSALWDNGNFSVHLGMTSFSGTGGDPQRYIAIYGPDSSGIIFKGDINDSQATSFIKRTNGVGNLTLYDTREVYLQASSSNYFKMNGSGIGINVQPFGTPYVLTLPNNSLQVAVAFSWLTYSDGRVKKEIKEIEYGINEVMKMKPVQYKHYSSEFVNNTLNIGDQYTNEIGFVAQDIHEIVKEAVNRGSEKELWSLDKSKLIPVLVKAVQELKAELDQLKENNA